MSCSIIFVERTMTLVTSVIVNRNGGREEKMTARKSVLGGRMNQSGILCERRRAAVQCIAWLLLFITIHRVQDKAHHHVE
jgi:hypothetical protein